MQKTDGEPFNEFEREFGQTDGETPLPPGYREQMLAAIELVTREETGVHAVEVGTGRDVMAVEISTTGETKIATSAYEAVTGETAAIDAEECGQRAKLRRLRTWQAVAAAMLILIAGTWTLQRRDGSKNRVNKAEQQLAAIIWIDEYNTGDKPRALTLPDHSDVKLYPGGRIRYRSDFGRTGKRAVEVKGAVGFRVEKNEELPFMVSSEGLNTLVLGTTFDVSAVPGSEQIKVKLYEGKVMVSVEQLVAGNERKEYYLAPGQEFVFDRKDRSVAINDLNKRHNGSIAKARNATMRPDSVANWYMFNNQQLADVLDQLSAIYNIPIHYSKADVRSMYFIGRLEKRDSLHKIIQDIALLNHLTVMSHDGTYIIAKPKP